MLGMQAVFGQAPLRWGCVMAFASMISIPVLIVFLRSVALAARKADKTFLILQRKHHENGSSPAVIQDLDSVFLIIFLSGRLPSSHN
jgi:hypothetical protein